MKLLLTLFFEFFKTGLFSVGGGMATLPFLYRISENHPEWFSVSDLANMIAVSESTPGPIGVNMATYVGYTTAGIPGALTATFGLVTPSVIVILIVAAFLAKFKESRYVNAAFSGVRPCSLGLIASAGLLVSKITFLNGSFNLQSLNISYLNWKALVLCAVLLVLTRVVKFTKELHPLYFILFSAAAGIVFGF